jgi:hypothetical protein
MFLSNSIVRSKNEETKKMVCSKKYLHFVTTGLGIFGLSRLGHWPVLVHYQRNVFVLIFKSETGIGISIY